MIRMGKNNDPINPSHPDLLNVYQSVSILLRLKFTPRQTIVSSTRISDIMFPSTHTHTCTYVYNFSPKNTYIYTHEHCPITIFFIKIFEFSFYKFLIFHLTYVTVFEHQGR